MPDINPDSVNTEMVAKLHDFDDLDTRPESHHHTLGGGPMQAAPGSHTHRGGDSLPLLSGLTISGSRATDAWRVSIIALLVSLGATDQSSA